MALSAGLAAVVLGKPWFFQGSALDLDFQNNRAAVNNSASGSATGQLTLTRTTVGYAQTQSGLWTSFASGAFRITDKGLLIEEARTNDALWARDMTNVAWTALNMTAALTSTGIDGASNSATRLTATAGNATILQAITLGSQADTYSVFLRRITGTGNVDITVDNGTTWTTQTLTAAYQQFQVVKTAANPIIGIRIVTSGDAVDADFSQLEPGGFATSPILTTTVAVTRNADVVTITPNSFYLGASGAALIYTNGLVGVLNLNTKRFVAENGGADFLAVAASATTVAAQNAGAANVLTATLGSGTTASLTKSGFSWTPAGRSVVANGGTVVTSGVARGSAAAPIILGNIAAGTRALNGYVTRLVGFTAAPADTTLQSWTKP